MTATVESARETTARALMRELIRARERDEAEADPALLLRHVRCVDNTTGDRFVFHMADDGSGWEWQHTDVLNWWMDNQFSVILKARQLGITWIAAGLALWYLLYKPGTRVLIQSKNEDDAADVVDHIWEMYLSLGRRENEDETVTDYSHLRNGVVPVVPGKEGVRPHLNIEFRHRDGRISQLNAMASTAGAGHGRTAALVILDEFSRHPYAREAWKAVVPAAGGSKLNRAKVLVISTGNGVSDEQGGGNFFHHLWDNAAHFGLATQFLRWDRNPDRDQDWYERIAMALPLRDRGEQYPMTELEAFILSGDPYFDPAALLHYRDHLLKPVSRGYFEEIDPEKPGKARWVEREDGMIQRFEKPAEEGDYAIFCDVSSGRGLDYTSAHVIDLRKMRIAAVLHVRREADAVAEQLHYLGRHYNTAVIALENAGGWAEPHIIFLKDGKNGRRPYPRLYKYRHDDRPDHPERAEWGFPMNTRTRPLVIAHLERVLREKTLPALDEQTLKELQTFVHRKTMPSPAAQDGANDDRVMSLAGALELYRKRGHHPKQKSRRPPREPKRLRDYSNAYGGHEEDD